MSDSTAPVLLIEGHDESRRRHEDTLREAGFAVNSVSDCGAALQVLADLVPRLVVLSFDPQTRDECLALCLQLKADPRTRDVPVILASARIDESDLRFAMDVSVLAVAVPPLDGTKLASAVKGVLAVRPTAA